MCPRRIDSPPTRNPAGEKKRKEMGTPEISRANNTLSANKPNHTYLRPTEKKAERRARMRRGVDTRESSPRHSSWLSARGPRASSVPLRVPRQASELLASCRYCHRSFAPFCLELIRSTAPSIRCVSPIRFGDARAIRPTIEIHCPTA
jgi:hypothetical protein